MPSHRDTILDQFSRQAVPFSTAAPIRDERALQLLVDAAGAEPGSEPVIRRMFEDSVADDSLGLETRREAGRLRFTYSNVVLSAVR